MSKVSVLIATYNRKDFLSICIESVLSQTFKDIEIVIIDDGSTDFTEELIKEKYKDKVIYYRSSSNRGVAFARNLAYKYASGEFICLLDSDDMLLDNRYLETALDLMKSEAVDIFCCDNYCIDKANKRFSNDTFFQTTIDHRGLVLSSGVKDFDYVFFHGIHSCGMIIKKSVIEKIGFLNTAYKIAWDEDLFLRIASNPEFKIYYYNKPLAGYRIHNNNLSGNLSKLYREKIACRIKILNQNKENKKRLGYRINRRLASQYYCLADAYKQEGRMLCSFMAIVRMFILYPFAFIDFLIRRKELPSNLYEASV